VGYHQWAAEHLSGETPYQPGCLEINLFRLMAWSYYLLPVALACLTWAHLNSVGRPDTLAQLLLTPATRGAILRAALLRPKFQTMSLHLALIPLLILTSGTTAWMPAFPLVEILPSWNTGVVDGQCWDWWFTYMDPADAGLLLAAATAIVGLHCTLRHAVAVSALCWTRGRASRASLAWSLLWTLAPVAAGLALAHLIQVGILQPALSYEAERGSLPAIVERCLISVGRVPFYYAVAVLNATILLPVAVTSLFSGLLLRSAARRLDAPAAE
jgi:hypothetical protein